MLSEKLIRLLARDRARRSCSYDEHGRPLEQETMPNYSQSPRRLFAFGPYSTRTSTPEAPQDR